MMAKSVKDMQISDFAVLAAFFTRVSVLRRMVSGHLGIMVEPFVVHLHRQGYTRKVIRNHVGVVEHFGHWLKQERVPPEQLSVLHVQRFLREHLPRCRCPSPAPKAVGCCRAGLGRLVEFLRSQRQIKPLQARTVPATPTEQLVGAYDRHLHRVCGLSEETRQRRQRTARRFLRWQFGSRPPQWRQFHGRDIADFVTEQAHGLGRGGIHGLVACVRSFVGFLEFAGRVPQGLAQAVPRPRRLAAPVPPQVLEPTQWRRFLKSFDSATRQGRRDYAMALCLGALGLRSQEVAALTLEDLDWRAMTIRLTRTKQRRQRLLPLPDRVARAILSYLKTGRPTTQSRALFVRHHAPVGRALAARYIRQLVRRAFTRCGIKPAGTHVLRHTWATWAHRRGAGLKLIADVLGHRSLETSQRYAQVNLAELRQAALPWPRIKS
jgi:integrase/recombinase XerD